MAKQIEVELGAIRLTPDEWITAILGHNPPDQAQLDAARDPVEALLWNYGLIALERGVDVIQDFGGWSREERDRFRSQAETKGATTEIRFMDIPFETLLERLDHRNANLTAGEILLAPSKMHEYQTLFEPPTLEECQRLVIHSADG